jgi:hypothetical protein
MPHSHQDPGIFIFIQNSWQELYMASNLIIYLFIYQEFLTVTTSYLSGQCKQWIDLQKRMLVSPKINNFTNNC